MPAYEQVFDEKFSKCGRELWLSCLQILLVYRQIGVIYAKKTFLSGKGFFARNYLKCDFEQHTKNLVTYPLSFFNEGSSPPSISVSLLFREIEILLEKVSNKVPL